MRRIGRGNAIGSDFAALLIRTDENCTECKAVDANNIPAPQTLLHNRKTAQSNFSVMKLRCKHFIAAAQNDDLSHEIHLIAYIFDRTPSPVLSFL